MKVISAVLFLLGSLMAKSAVEGACVGECYYSQPTYCPAGYWPSKVGNCWYCCNSY
ncbi:hypothetical protein AB4K20DRAFT_1895074 [Rhizopus microsporus]|uniref:CBM1 domain-containing protein n=1 Tax=Rhizopus microsporus TaxID=58291 RepID=A0A1X0S3N8_RHIZD|nr:hypothetical protein BCV71DRAFT_226639 [Rhizopus microsporus]